MLPALPVLCYQQPSIILPDYPLPHDVKRTVAEAAGTESVQLPHGEVTNSSAGTISRFLNINFKPIWVQLRGQHNNMPSHFIFKFDHQATHTLSCIVLTHFKSNPNYILSVQIEMPTTNSMTSLFETHQL